MDKYGFIVYIDRRLFKITKNTQSAFLLAYINQLQGKDEWVCKTSAEMQEQIYLSRSEIESARKRLREITDKQGNHIWLEKLEGLPARLSYSVNRDALDSLLQEFE